MVLMFLSNDFANDVYSYSNEHLKIVAPKMKMIFHAPFSQTFILNSRKHLFSFETF